MSPYYCVDLKMVDFLKPEKLNLFLVLTLSSHLIKSSSISSFKYLNVSLSGSADEAVLSGIDSQRFNRRVVGLETLLLVSMWKLQDGDPTFPPAGEEKLPPLRHRKHGGAGIMAAES